MKNNYCVYKHTCPNGKVYIGVTCQKPETRWGKNGEGYLKKNKNGQYVQPVMAEMILKYGWDNIKHEILYEDLTKEEAEIKEIELISTYKSNQEEYGYNIKSGGNINEVSEQTKKKIRSSLTGKKLDDKTKNKISNSLKNHIVSEETKNKLRSLNKCKPVRCIETGKIYESIANASKQTGVNRGSILNVCNNKQKIAGGCHWEFVEQEISA